MWKTSILWTGSKPRSQARSYCLKKTNSYKTRETMIGLSFIRKTLWSIVFIFLQFNFRNVMDNISLFCETDKKIDNKLFKKLYIYFFFFFFMSSMYSNLIFKKMLRILSHIFPPSFNIYKWGLCKRPLTSAVNFVSSAVRVVKLWPGKFITFT